MVKTANYQLLLITDPIIGTTLDKITDYTTKFKLCKVLLV